MSISSVHNLFQEISKLQAEVQKIQATCPHTTTSVKMYSWRPGALNPVRLCNDCMAVTKITVTESEYTQCWADFNKGTL